MTFRIISCGWQAGYFPLTTLQSIEEQTCRDFTVSIGYEGYDEANNAIRNWVAGHEPARYVYDFREDPSTFLYDNHSRYKAITNMPLDDEDVIIFLDIDGDKFWHPHVLSNLIDYYSDGTLLTYGSYQPYPDSPTCSPAQPYPDHIIESRDYRAFGLLWFNHLRTMKGKVFKAIPQDQFKWAGTNDWYPKGCDVTFTISGLELVGRRHKVITETLMGYHSENPNSAWRVNPREIDNCTKDFMSRPKLDQVFF